MAVEPFEVPTSRPSPEPGESFERFVMRWNAWVDTFDPDADPAPRLNGAMDSIRQTLRELGEAGGDWPADIIDSSYPGDEQWERAAEVMQAIEPQLAEIRSAMSLQPHPLRVADSDTGGSPAEVAVNLHIDFSHNRRSASRWLARDVRHRAKSGDLDSAIETLRILNAAQRRDTELPLLIGWLSDFAIDWMLNHELYGILHLFGPEMSSNQLDALFLLSDTPNQWSFLEAVESERVLGAWDLASTFAGHEDGRLPRSEIESQHEQLGSVVEVFGSMREVGNLGPQAEADRFPARAPHRLASLQDHLEVTNQIYGALEADLDRDSRSDEESALSAIPTDPRFDDHPDRYFIALTSVTSLGMVNSLFRIADADTAARNLIIEIYRHRLRTGYFPQSLADLDHPDLIIDPSVGEPFGYRLEEGAPLLWSFGPDRDDDRGEKEVTGREWFSLSEWASLSPEQQAERDVDRILFPPKPMGVD